MASSTAATPEEYIAALPPHRREAVAAVRDVVRRNLPHGFEEGMAFGMIAWYVPLERFPDTYNGHPLGLAALASQKHYVSLYLNSVCGDPNLAEWFRARYAQSGKRLDMGKSCLRFRSLDDVPLDLIGETMARVPVDQFIAQYQAARGSARKTRSAAGA
ncbi:MAG TPA: DUF1801 domain-containing protein [Candidatus Limnocylindria bacterium]|nr:DUF1801 domain-containing protein [Candidatus Limnocylindria bacterium]